MAENKNAKTPADDGKPVAWQLLGLAHFRRKIPAGSQPRYWDPLYAAPPKKQWVGLTDDERREIFDACETTDRGYVLAMCEAKLREKNHG